MQKPFVCDGLPENQKHRLCNVFFLLRLRPSFPKPFVLWSFSVQICKTLCLWKFLAQQCKNIFSRRERGQGPQRTLPRTGWTSFLSAEPLRHSFFWGSNSSQKMHSHFWKDPKRFFWDSDSWNLAHVGSAGLCRVLETRPTSENLLCFVAGRASELVENFTILRCQTFGVSEIYFFVPGRVPCALKILLLLVFWMSEKLHGWTCFGCLRNFMFAGRVLGSLNIENMFFGCWTRHMKHVQQQNTWSVSELPSGRAADLGANLSVFEKCDCWWIWNVCGEQIILWANEIRDRWLKERAQQCFRTQRDDVSLLTLSMCNICSSNLICATSSSAWPLYPQLRLTLFPQSTELCRAAGKMEEDKGKDTERKTSDPRRQKSERNEEHEKTKRNMSKMTRYIKKRTWNKNTNIVKKEKTEERKRENKEQVILILDFFCGLSIFGARREESPCRQGPNKKEEESKEWEKMKKWTNEKNMKKNGKRKTDKVKNLNIPVEQLEKRSKLLLWLINECGAQSQSKSKRKKKNRGWRRNANNERKWKMKKKTVKTIDKTNEPTVLVCFGDADARDPKWLS